MKALTYIYIASILFSILAAFVYRKDLRSRKLIILLPFLIYVLLQEVVLTIFNDDLRISSSAPFYNIYRPLTAVVFAWIYYSIPFMRPERKLIAWVVIVYLVLIIINYCFVKSIFDTGSYPTVFRGFVISICAVLFLFRYFNLDNAELEKYWQPMIWITVGVAIFYPVVSISLTFHPFLAALNANVKDWKLYQFIPQLMSIFMYSCFSYAFYLCRKKN